MRIGEMKESKFIKKEDVGEAGKNLTIRELKHENVAGENSAEDMKYVLYFKEAQKGVVLNWTNIQMAAKLCGSEDSDDWVGKQIQLYEDPNISFGGKIVGGIRFRKATGSSSEPVQSENPAPAEDDFNDSIPF